MRTKYRTLKTLLASLPLILGGCAGTSKGVENITIKEGAPAFYEVNRQNLGRYQFGEHGNFVNAIDFMSTKPENPFNQSTYNAFGPVFFKSDKTDVLKEETSFNSFYEALDRARGIIPHIRSKQDRFAYSNPEPINLTRPDLNDIEILQLGKVEYEFDASGLDESRVRQAALIGLYNSARQVVANYNGFVYGKVGDAEGSSHYNPGSGKFLLSGPNERATSADVDCYSVSSMSYEILPNGKARATGHINGFNMESL